MDLSSVGKSDLIDKLNKLNIEEYKEKLNTDIYTLEDIIMNLKKQVWETVKKMNNFDILLFLKWHFNFRISVRLLINFILNT